ncbi:DUF72 domain-containing protein [Parafrigoribacterium mesophilum]|uniref:DUF72 domain-containing protein n=1 Tax=Parafrigoribacterium mesophilum TaxID=433646 RepID=UPI0031FDAA14
MDGAPVARVGISGWRYAPWRGVFYPPALPQRLELHYAAQRLRTIEINGSFYSLQRPTSYRRWADDTPDDFVFSVKGPRYITHMLRLRDSRTALANFFASGVLGLGGKLGPVLWQLPERNTFDPDVVAAFFGLLPRSTGEAAVLAAAHDARLDDRSWFGPGVDRPLRHALEVRHPSFIAPASLDLLRRHGVALVAADAAGRWPSPREVTADFVYARLHGADELYTSGYTDAALDDWADTVRGWRDGSGTPDGVGRDVFVYFDNDVKVRAPFDAMGLAERLAR